MKRRSRRCGRTSFKVGDLVRVTTGTHVGRCGIVDAVGLDLMLVLPLELRDRKRLHVRELLGVAFKEAALVEFGVGDRVTVIDGRFDGARGRITGHHDAARLTVLFDEWWPVGAGRHLMAPLLKSDLGPYTVPPSARPRSVGALYHPARGSR